MGKGSTTTTNQTTTAPDSQASALYRQILGQAQGVASTPYQQYTGELTAPINAQQQTGIAGINSAANYAQPYIQQAAGMVSGAANPLTAGQIQNYQNPYQQQVIDATMAQAAQGNAQQQAQLKGNTISSGALGGNREGVAQANLASQQSTALNSQLAALNSQNYSQALSTAQQQYQTNPMAAAYSLGNLGTSGQTAALTGAGAQLGAGTVQQQSQQAADTANYGQYTQQQAYPYQQLSWLAGLGTGVGSQLGGTSNGSTTTPPPSPWGQILGAGLTAASFMNRGGGVKGFAGGGAPSVMPWSDGVGWIPTLQITHGGGAPHGSAPSAPQQSQADPAKQAQQFLGLSNSLHDRFSGPAYGNGSALAGDAYGGSSSSPLAGLSADDYGPGFAQGGSIRGFAGGGAPTDFLSLTNGDPGWASHDVGPGYAMPGSSMMTPFEARGGFGDLPQAKVDTDFLRSYQNSSQDGVDPRIEKAITDNTPAQVPVPRARPDSAPTTVASADDGDVLPAAAAPTRGFAPSLASRADPVDPATLQSSARPTGDDSPGVKGFGLGLGKYIGLPDISPAARTGLLAAGLGMLASRSSNLGNAIGDGGLAGVGAYSGVKTAEAKQVLDNRKLDQQAAQLADEAKKAQADLALRTASQQESARHNKASESLSADKVPTGMERAADGSLRAIPGYVEALTQVTNAKKPPGGAAIDDDTASFVADQVLAGDSRALVGFGRGAQGAENLIKVRQLVAQKARAEGKDPTDILNNIAIQSGNTATQRTFGTQTAKMAINATEAQGAIELGRTASSSVPRTNWVPVNRAIQAYQSGTSDPALAKFGAANLAIINTYARAISPTGVPTVNDKQHAEHLLSTATGQDAYNAVLDQMNEEIKIAHGAPAKAKKEIEDIRKGRTSDAPASAAGFTPPTGAIARQYQGKTYYYDPATKQPYPGQ